jgi:tetratricopeptide (TPR) repeat protein
MTATNLRNALGVLQDEPDHSASWADLVAAVAAVAPGGTEHTPEVAALASRLLEAARRAHEMRREYDAVGMLLPLEIQLALTPAHEADLLAELASVRDDILHDDVGAVEAYQRLAALRPEDTAARDAVERAEAKRAKWKELAQRYFAESKAAADPSFKSSLLVAAAETAYRYGRIEFEARKKGDGADPRAQKKKKASVAPPKDPEVARREFFDKIIALLKDALALDPRNRRALLLEERLLRDEKRWDELVEALETFANESSAKDEKIAALLRESRVLRQKLSATDRANRALERVLDLSPAHPEATQALVNSFTDAGMWDHIVALYEDQLQSGSVRAGHEAGIVLQVAMVNWKMLNKPEAAAPYFERLRGLEPAHPGMLEFFRHWCMVHAPPSKLIEILSDAQRAMSDGPLRAKLAAEIASLAEDGANAQKAIEQWRTVLRTDPGQTQARDALKRLYRQTGAFNHLADVLRGELERIGPEDVNARLPVLAEIAAIYRDHIRSDSALVTVLSQIIGLDAGNVEAVRELARVYEALGRWRDLLTTQMRLAELETDAATKASLYRTVGRRWLDQFSNVQNGVEAYEKLRELVPNDPEAISKLKELYTKRRAYRPLFDVRASEASRAEGPERRVLRMEMARICAERLDRGADAMRFYRLVLEASPDDREALEAVEKLAERDKDFGAVAEAVERRADLTEDVASKVALLQKLGTIVTERLNDAQRAERVWKRVLELEEGNAKARRILRDHYLAIFDLDALTALYASANEWEALAEVLSNAADRVSDVHGKVDLSLRAAAVFEGPLSAPGRAVRAYERVLSVEPTNLRAVTALVPIYEADEKWGRLPALYELLLRSSNGDFEKRALCKKMAIVTGDKLGDMVTAFGYATRMFELSDGGRSAVRELDSWARASGQWIPFARALEARANAASTKGTERRMLRTKRAEVLAMHSGASDETVAAYRELILAEGGDEEATSALERLLRTAPERRADFRWLLRTRATGAPTAAARVGILSALATAEEDVYGAPDEAISLYREILEIDPGHAVALRSVGRLLMASGRADEAKSALERERDLATGTERLAREIDIARLCIGSLGRPLDALAAAKRALELAKNDPQAIKILEDLLPVAETRAQSALVLEHAYGEIGDFRRQADVLAVLSATAPSKVERLAYYERLADAKLKVGDATGAFDVIAKAAMENSANLALWDRLGVLANKTQRSQRFVDALVTAVPPEGESGLPPAVELDLAERIATLYDEMLGEIDRATPYLERILAREPTNERAFARLKQILSTRERWQDLDTHYERLLAATSDPSRRVDWLNERAILAEEITGDAPKAIVAYEEILALEPKHEPASFALDKLYATVERWDSLAALLTRRIERASASTRPPLKLRLAMVLMNHLGDPKAALDTVEEVIAADGSQRDARELVEKCLEVPSLRERAAILLEGAYSERDSVADLVRILEVRLEFEADDMARCDRIRQIAELRDQRLLDDAGAFDAYARLLPLAPGDVEARTRMLAIAERLDALESAATTLLVAADNAGTPQPAADLLLEVAAIYDASEHSNRAEYIYRRIVNLAPDDPSIALSSVRSLERILVADDRTAELAGVLRKRVLLEGAAETRRELYGRIATIEEDVLLDDSAAIEAWTACVQANPADVEALTALDRLYSRTNAVDSLITVLRAREALTEEPVARRQLRLRTARLLAARSADPTDALDAIALYRAVLDEFGADGEIFAALARLYEQTEAWPELAEVLEDELALASVPTGQSEDRVALLMRLGDVRRTRLGAVNEAIDAYREVLLVDAEHTEARAVLETLLDDPEARHEVAELLRPFYEVKGKEELLLRVLEIQIEHQPTVEGRLALYERLVFVAGTSLNDAPKAFS